MATPDNIHRILVPGNAREEAYVLHPLVTDKVKLPTPAIKNAFNVIKNAVIQRESGVAFIANPRFGKSSAIEVIERFLPQSFPDIPIFRVIAKGHQRSTEKGLFEDILFDLGSSVGSGWIAATRRNKIVGLMKTACQANHGDRLLLFVDEAQNWDESELSWIRDISNDLARDDIRMITILFAHPMLERIRQQLLRDERTDLIFRFLVRVRHFGGIRSLQDIKDVFSVADDAGMAEFPLNSQVCYSRFFRPHEFDSLGWRLEHEAEACWIAFNTEMMRSGGQREIGMRWLMGAVRTWLNFHWEIEHGALFDGGNLWPLAVQETGFSFSYSSGTLKKRSGADE